MTPSRASVEVRMVSQYLPLLAVERRLRHQLRHADDAVHRRPDLVAHRREEDAFEARLALGAIARLRELDGARDDLLLEAGPRRVGPLGGIGDQPLQRPGEASCHQRQHEAGREPGAQAGGDRRGRPEMPTTAWTASRIATGIPAAAKPATTGGLRREKRRGAVASIGDGRGACPDAAPSPAIDGRRTALESTRLAVACAAGGGARRVRGMALEPTFSGDNLLATVGPHVDMLEELRDTFAEQYPEVLAAIRGAAAAQNARLLADKAHLMKNVAAMAGGPSSRQLSIAHRGRRQCWRLRSGGPARRRAERTSCAALQQALAAFVATLVAGRRAG